MTKNKLSISKLIFIVFIVLLHLLPIYISLVSAFKKKTDLGANWKIPNYIYFDNFILAVKKGVFQAMGRSFIVTVVVILLVVIIGAMSAYPLARNQSKLNTIILNIILAVMMIPPLSMLVPLVTMLSGRNLFHIKGTNTYWAIILVVLSFQLPVSIFMYTNFIKSIPKDLDEAAEIDGCSRFKIFFTIILPMLKPVTSTVIILTGVFTWNDYQFSLYLWQKHRSVTTFVASYFSASSFNLNSAAASAIIVIIPITILYLSLQKYFIKSSIDSAVK
ncbi:carbohydrate ABC transporter permease [Oceanivirga salmonicida]|uniref:carbohydrate ABC transporter permease n=1 Tax=Oceanivirga salmonicida TaxID=1769291 RepID=UPI00082AECCE|nr:carbohydrate ABC transporter permease [Oceanivirga salmonicida]